MIIRNIAHRFLVPMLFCLLLPWNLLHAQAEIVSVDNPVYDFLKRMEVKGLIDRYHDAVLPLSRQVVASYLDTLTVKRGVLSGVEQEMLARFFREFQFDRNGDLGNAHSIISSSSAQDPSGFFDAEMSEKEKFVYAGVDSSVAFFANGLLDIDGRAITGDALGSTLSEFVQVGARIRGSIWKRLGFYGQFTNSAFWGSRALLARDRIVAQSHELDVGSGRNFDFSEGSIRYDAGIVSAEIGSERILWGLGYDQKMVLSDNARPSDVLQFDLHYKGLSYSFVHAWLLGSSSSIVFSLPSDTSARFVEPVNADKYLAAHRIEFVFSPSVTAGFQEMYVYSNRAPDLAYFNPLVLLESAQRRRGERDNGFWAFDLKTCPWNGVQVQGTILYDDINVPYMFSDKWFDRYAWQVGGMIVDPLGVRNTAVMVEYTRVEPYVFSHGRSREDSYTNSGDLLGTRIFPNSDSWFFRLDCLIRPNLTVSARVTFIRHGNNIFALDGTLIRNVGGDPLQPHRDSDPETKRFLDGDLVRTGNVQVQATWQPIRQIWLDGIMSVDSQQKATDPSRQGNRFLDLRLRMVF